MNTRRTFLPFALPDTGDAEIDAIAEAVRSGWITKGPKTKQFEEEFSAAVGSEHSIAVNSCTSALHLALEAAGIKRGDEVITTPFTFATCGEVIRYLDARPVFADVDPITLNIDPAQVEMVLTENTRAVLPVHFAGRPVEMDAVSRIARRGGLTVIEDAAHAFPAKHGGRMIGGLSDFTCFSFYATKTITTGEGGMVCTNNDAWAERCRVMALHGIAKDVWKRYTAEGSWYYEITAPGFKYNMTDVAAAMGLVQLGKAERMRSRREAIARWYNDAFGDRPELQVPAEAPEGDQHAWHLYSLRLNLERMTAGRDEFIDELRERGIGTSVHFIPLHVHPYYRDTYGYEPEDFPVAYREYLRVISLPIYSRMTDDDVTDVVHAVLAVADAHRH